MSDTGKRIKLIRKRNGISADKLAEALGCSRSTIFRYENGDIDKVPGEYLPVIASVLNVSPAELMGWTDNLDEDTDFIADIFRSEKTIQSIRKLLDLSPSSQKSVFDMIDFIYQKEKGPQ